MLAYSNVNVCEFAMHFHFNCWTQKPHTQMFVSFFTSLSSHYFRNTRKCRISQKFMYSCKINHRLLRHFVWNFFANVVMQITFVIRAYWLWLPSGFLFDSSECFVSHLADSHFKYTSSHTSTNTRVNNTWNKATKSTTLC